MVTEFQMFDEFPKIVEINPLGPVTQDGSADDENPNEDINDPNSDVDIAVDVGDASVVSNADTSGASEIPDTVDAESPAVVAAAWATAAACPISPPGLVVLGGSKNGFNTEAVAEAAA